MNEFGFPKRAKKSIDELNIVPILDMFVAIVFFLLLSASMVGMTKIVLPPSATTSVASDSPKRPLNPKLLVFNPKGAEQDTVKVILKWEGATPGSQVITVKEDIFKNEKIAIDEIKEMVAKFKEKFPEEKTIQISMQSKVPYQWLVSAMDGVRELLPDMVLNSYTLADAMTE